MESALNPSKSIFSPPPTFSEVIATLLSITKVFYIGSSQKHSAARWCLQNIAQESIDSSDEEFFDARADVMEGKNAILLGMSQWNSNDLVEQIETLGHMEDHNLQGKALTCCIPAALAHMKKSHLYKIQLGVPRCPPQSSIEGLEDIEQQEACSKRKCQTHVLLLVVHGGHILDTAGGDPGTKSGDVATLASVLEKVTRAHFKAASEHVMIKLVPCPAVCAEAFSLVSNLNPYSYDESCVSSSVDHLPLAALPLLAIVSPRYQDTVATVIARNQVYHSFLQSEEGQGFTGQVCLMGDCVGGVLCFDALCFSNHQRPISPNNSSRNNSTESLKDSSGLRGDSSPGLSSSKRLSKSNIDISAPNEGHSQSRPPLSRKQSDSYDGDSSSTGQRCFFLECFCPSLMKDSMEARGCSSATLVVNPGRFDFDVTDCFLLGCPLGLVLAMRRTVLPAVQVNQLHPACSQIFNLFYPSDPSASRLEPLLQPLFHKLPPFGISRYQRYPLGDGRSTLIAAHIDPHLI
uniref:PITPNM family member 3 n=1 Tax=Tetraodon nigroviridis TaxID=99883 RepID=H3DFL4_TETNG